MPGQRITIETDRHGQPIRFTRRHSTSHHPHHHHHHWDDDRTDTSNEELAGMRERERLLLEANDRLSRENHNLKVNLDITEQDLRHHRAALAQANANVRDLAVENGNLRRSLEAYHNIEERHHNKTKELRNRITRLENETETLRARIRELTGNLRDAVDARVRALTKEVAEWRRRWESLDKVYTKLSGNLDYYIKKSSDLSEENVILRRESESYERILRRHRLI